MALPRRREFVVTGFLEWQSEEATLQCLPTDLFNRMLALQFGLPVSTIQKLRYLDPAGFANVIISRNVSPVLKVNYPIEDYLNNLTDYKE